MRKPKSIDSCVRVQYSAVLTFWARSNWSLSSSRRDGALNKKQLTYLSKYRARKRLRQPKERTCHLLWKWGVWKRKHFAKIPPPPPFVLVWRSLRGFAPTPPPICVFHHVLLLLPSLVMKEWEWKKCDICWRCVRNIEWFDPTLVSVLSPFAPLCPPQMS